ncbi:hypothetical protein SGGMMB4_02075 [Sodalis glossinidius str. 'morsitans']|uniref:Uncharacterized protein n=1 Tax=Sodalis glossinidius (strain morsitans) TaxID=343509 RepID=A0A193QI28_SODGM|nr:hypothetical protein [Sodalis glossinidius]CRL44778.1 hypothetical protein SGGMMB4_02075 [Sodalis glossinidius str. 'morsitans']
MSLLDNIPPQVQTLRMSQEWRRFCLIQALEYRRLGMREAKKESLHYAHTEKLNIKYFMPNGNEPF